MTATLAQVVAALEGLWDPRTAESWDAVGTVCGDPDAEVRRILMAVDPVEQTVDEAVEDGFDLLVTHHPLYLRGTSTVSAATPKGRLVHRLIRSGVGLHVAHTNADAAVPGVSDALARAVGVEGPLEPLDPQPADPLDKIVVFVPAAQAEQVVDALAAAGAGELGDYSRAANLSDSTGTFRPGPGAHPSVGRAGESAYVAETRVEMVLPRARRAAVVAAMRAAHPYEEPAFDVLELALPAGPRGIGRVGRLARPVALDEFAARVASALPPTVVGVRTAGDPDAVVERVAVCGGSGDSFVAAATAAGADAYVTADLRHHPVSESQLAGGPALLDVGHWASEWPWLAQAAQQIVTVLSESGTTVEVEVSETCTDPWTIQSSVPDW
ncbi:dinuclear metal center YbgI/SA1388 family protein [Motilibacter peucedani]|uniref:GTP cyclohydrolase 1 type 2 homolog n=1 Tax=Motilibacter peucedani TaxID=598650 RepID=A0A420XP43_9ACTN|nr:Nif3-like dinuclear metal center hexameric protein [Motilibacter peucedani]RKS73970.1 dinuclear metal center YbgI/SA1388 family protein [Motilibacter peucedani]